MAFMRLALAGAMILLAALAAGLVGAGPAAASPRSFFTDSGDTYTCGSPTMGMRGVLKLSGAATCTTTGTLTVPASPASATIAIFYMPAVLSSSRSVPVRGTSLNADILATTPGTVTVELGYGANTASFTALGSVTAEIANPAVPLGGVFVDLSGIWGTVPVNNFVALRLTKVTSGFAGTIRFRNSIVGLNNSIRGSFFEGAWKVPGDFATIQDSVNSTSVLAGDRIYLAAGTYAGAGFTGVDFGSKSLTVISESGPERTTIDCQYGTWAFRFGSGVTSAGGLEGLTIKRANLSSVLIIGTAYPVIRNCVFRDNDSATVSGGAVRLSGNAPSAALIDGCTFVNNRTSSMDPTLNNGGAISVSAPAGLTARLTVRGSSFLRNAATRFGGAVFVDAALADVQILDSAFVENNALEGGALHADSDGAVRVERCRFERNYAQTAGAAYSRRVAFLSSVFHQNGASGYMGAVYARAGSATVHTVLDYCTLTGNFARSTGGVGVAGTGYVTIANSILWGDWHTDPTLGESGKELVIGSGSRLRLGNSDVQGGTAAITNRGSLEDIDGRGIMDEDPRFAFEDAPHLMPGSPCINKGIDSPSLPTGMGLTHPAYDADGVPRNLAGGAAGPPARSKRGQATRITILPTLPPVSM